MPSNSIRSKLVGYCTGNLQFVRTNCWPAHSNNLFYFLYMHPSRLTSAELLDQCSVVRQKRSGPGGQHRNKVETGIIVTHNESGIRGEATERRSQQENLRVAVQRLQVNLALHLRENVFDSGPSQFWKNRFRSGTLKINPSHSDFGAILSELLDVFSHCDWDQKRVAEWFETSPSQVVKLLKTEPKAFSLVNKQRDERGLAKLR